MGIDKPAIVIWCGAASNQRALAVKLSRKFNVAGIVIDEKKHAPVKKSISQIASLLFDRLRFKTIYDGWKRLQEYYQSEFNAWPDVPILKVDNINSKDTSNFTLNLTPQLVVVSGTGLVKKELVSIPVPRGVINLHTGLSPYVKGGPNCTNWCIANDEWHLVGNTIMFISTGIDSGNIIVSEAIDVRSADSLFESQKIVMEHAHELYQRAITYLLDNEPPYHSVPQETLGKGRLFLTKMWTSAERKKLLKNWRNRNNTQQLPSPPTVAFPSNQ